MAAAAMVVQPYPREPMPSFDPYLASDTTCAVSGVPQDVPRTSGGLTDTPAPGTSARVPRRPSVNINTDPDASSGVSQPSAALPSHHSIPPVTDDAHLTDWRGDCNGQDTPSPDSPTPPPVPPKPHIQDRPKSVKSVSILAPTDISPVPRVFSLSVSDSGHSYRPHFAASSESAPARPAYIISQHLAARSSAAGRLSFSSDALPVRPSSMEPVTRKASSIRARRNRLHKTRPRPPSPTHSPTSSVLSLLLTRAFGSGEHSSRHHSSRSSPSMSDRSHRPTRSLSDGSSKIVLPRPSPSSRSSGTTDSSCTTSSSASTSVSYASTSLTTPDSSSPRLSPRSSTRTNKLQKKRPSLAPSAYPYALGTSSAALGRSKSTPIGLGQRAPKTRIWSSVEEARIAAEEADDSGEQDPSLWYSSPADTSPSRKSGLGPILEVRRKSSSQALSDLACTGLCSTSLAAYASEHALDADATEQLHTLRDNPWHDADTRGEPFNPYTQCASPPGEASTSIAGGHIQSDKPAFPALSVTQSASLGDSQSSAGESSSGFAVVGGYLDRSEDAMRRWTLAMADVPEDVLVQHLERLRKESMAFARGRLPGRRSAAPSQIGHGDDELTVDTRDRRSSFFFGGPREMGISPRSPSRARFSVGDYDRDLDGDDSDDEALFDEGDEEDWKTARQVLFCCRELVQTERNYQARLRELASTELSHHYASLIARHIPALLRVSETLLAHVIDDPSAWGVSAAFIGCEEELEAAFVAWSAVVGEFFLEDANLRPPRKLKKHTEDTMSDIGHGSTGIGRIMRTRSQVGIPASKAASMSTRRYSSAMSDIGHGDTSSSLGHSGAGMFTAALGTGLAFGLSVSSPSPLEPESPKAKSMHGHGGLSRVSTMSSGLGLTKAVTAWKRMSMPSSLSNVPSLLPTSPTTAYTHSPSHHGHSHHHSTGSAHGHGTPKKAASEHDAKMSVRDLAIQPTQRVMRYVLQYRDLLDHTPTTSPSRGLVERAYESALRIAKKCDRAQAHAAFFRQSVPKPKNDIKQASRQQTTTN